MTTIQQWEMRAPREPLARAVRDSGRLASGQALVRVAGCGLCHTDLGFYLGEARTRHPLPLVLGHEVSGVVEEAGEGAERWVGRAVVVPAILPCGECSACRRGRYALCPDQVFPGSTVDGGFASHVVVPARWLCDVAGMDPARAGDAARTDPAHVDEAAETDPARLALLSVLADAASTPFEAIARSGLAPGELAIFVGAGGVGGFGVQIAAALGATVVAIDPSAERRRLAGEHGAALVLDPVEHEPAALRKMLRDVARERRLPAEEWKIFETSGTKAGQETAFALLVRGAHLAVVGYTPAAATVPLSHLMALDARAVGNWGCDPARFPELMGLVRSGRIAIEPYVEVRPMSEINAVFEAALGGRLSRRAVLVPDSL